MAALEREVWPFVKQWPATRHEYDGREFKFFEKEQMVVVCGGIGSEAARRAAEAVINLYHPSLLISAGFAGALDASLSPGHSLTPQHVINATDGSRTELHFGNGVLVTFDSVADVEQKAKLAKAYGAHAVDMEAAAVAQAAEAHGIKFLACKVISDSAHTHLPPIAAFVGSDGRFHALKFLLFLGIRPWLWGSVLRLARNSAMAAETLCKTLNVSAQKASAEFETHALGREA